MLVGDTEVERPPVVRLSEFRLELNLCTKEQDFGGEEEFVFLRGFKGEEGVR